MNKVIIGIHGLGNKPPKETIEKWWLESMCEGLNNIGQFQYVPKFELVYWADILNDEPLDEQITDVENPYYLDEMYVKAPEESAPRDNSIRKKFLGFLEDQLDKIFLNDDLTSNFAFVSDLIFKNYFKELEIYYSKIINGDNTKGKTAKEKIRSRLSEVIKKYDGEEILLIAHSMGSIIAYDVCSIEIPNVKIDTLVTMGSPLGLPIVISKIADELKETNPELHKLATPQNVLHSWTNFYDLEDNVAINYNLTDDYKENTNGVQVVDVNVLNDYEINEEKNPHKSFGYLRAPEFSELLSEFLTKDVSNFELWQIKTKEKFIKFFKKIRGN